MEVPQVSSPPSGGPRGGGGGYRGRGGGAPMRGGFDRGRGRGRGGHFMGGMRGGGGMGGGPPMQGMMSGPPRGMRGPRGGPGYQGRGGGGYQPRGGGPMGMRGGRPPMYQQRKHHYIPTSALSSNPIHSNPISILNSSQTTHRCRKQQDRVASARFHGQCGSAGRAGRQ